MKYTHHKQILWTISGGELERRAVNNILIKFNPRPRQTYPVLPYPRYSFVSVPQWPHPLKYPHVIPGLPLSNWAFQSNIDLHQHVLPCFTNPWQSKCLSPLKKKWMVSIYVFICLRLIISLLDFPRMFSCRVQRSFLAVWRPGRR